MHTTYCLIYAFAGFRTKRIELTFLKCYSVKSLLTPAETSRNPGHEERSLIKLRRRVEGYVLALENIIATEEYNGQDQEKLLTLTVEELVAYAIFSGVNTINHANKPIFQQLGDQPSARPSCVSHFLPNIIRDRRWTLLDNLATDLFYGKVCCERYTISDRELTRLARILLEDWHETTSLNRFSPAPRKLAVYPVYRKKCSVWRIPPPTDVYCPGPSRIPAVAAGAAAAAAGAPAATSRARDDRSREKWKRRDEGQQVPLRRTEPPPSREDLKSLVVSETRGHTLPLRRRNTGTPIVTGAAATMSEVQSEKTILIALTEIPHISHLAAHLAQLIKTTVRPPPDLPVTVLVILPETLLVSPPATIPGGTANPAVVSQPKGCPVSQNHDLSLQKENPLIQSLKNRRNRKMN